MLTVKEWESGLIQQLLEETADLVGPVHKLYLQDPVPAVPIFVWLKYIVMIFRMYIQSHMAGSQLFMGEGAYYMTGYLSGELPAILFGQLGGVLEKRRTR